MTYVILGDSFTFPEGDASTNRVFSYAKGFIENGIDICVICFRNDYLTNFFGEIDQIKYYHPYSWLPGRTSFFLRRWQVVRKYYKTYAILKDITEKDNLVAIHCYTKSIVTQVYAFLLSLNFNSKLILERSEHPLKIYKSKISEKTLGCLKVAMEIKFCNYIFCISDYLINFYIKRGANNDKLFKVPSTVDVQRFAHIYASPVNFKYICYSGSLTTLKDGVDILIKSFAKIAFKFIDINLLLIGKADTQKDEIYFRTLASDLKIQNRVFFTGKLSRNEIPAYLCNAEILVLARPASMVADAGFPSKLTEYLAAGKPIVVTKVGEIPAYLTDEVNAFLSDPDSDEAFSERLNYVLDNYHFATKVGRNGSSLTNTIFNYNYQTKRIISFLEFTVN